MGRLLDLALNIKCFCCGEVHTVKVNKEDLEKYKRGEGHVQALMPYLSASDREMIISSTCGKCYDEMIGCEE